MCTANGVTAAAYRFMELKDTLLRMAINTASGMVSGTNLAVVNPIIRQLLIFPLG